MHTLVGEKKSRSLVGKMGVDKQVPNRGCHRHPYCHTIPTAISNKDHHQSRPELCGQQQYQLTAAIGSIRDQVRGRDRCR